MRAFAPYFGWLSQTQQQYSAAMNSCPTTGPRRREETVVPVYVVAQCLSQEVAVVGDLCGSVNPGV